MTFASGSSGGVPVQPCVRGLLLPTSDPVAARPSRVGVSTPEVLVARPARNAWSLSPVSRRTIAVEDRRVRPRASWRQSRSRFFVPVSRPCLDRVVHVATRRKDRSGASPDRSSAACAQSSNDRVAPRPRPTAESCGPPPSPSRATQSRVPSRCLRSSRPAQAEVAPGCQARSAHHGRVEPVTQAFDEPIEVVPVEQRRQPRVERMARRGGQVRRRDPQRRLIRLARSHSHARQCSTTDRLCRSLITPTFTTGC